MSTMHSGRHRLSRLAAAALALLLVAPAVRAAEPDAPAARIAVLDAGTFLVVEAHQASLADVLERLGSHLNITFANTERVDLSRVVDGRRIGTVFEIVQWLVPNQSFVLLYEDRTPQDVRKPRLERIGFLNVGTVDTPTGFVDAPVATVAGARSARTRDATGAPRARPDRSKAVLPAGPTTEIKTVAEQLHAATPEAQLQIERDMRDPARQASPPEFLRPQSDAAQTTLRQQAERSQALAVEQLRALMEAYQTACRRAGGDGPC